MTIPDNLYARLQVVKEKLNVSAVCQKAIEQVVVLEEIKMKALSPKEKAIERFRLEQKKGEQEWFDFGRAQGLKDAQDLSYDDFQQLWDLYQSSYDIERDDVWVELDQFPEDLHELLRERIENYSSKPIEESYLAGWIDGVTDFWNEIKNEI